MKYLEKRFTSPPNSKRFVDNWDATFSDGRTDTAPEKEEPKTESASGASTGD